MKMMMMMILLTVAIVKVAISFLLMRLNLQYVFAVCSKGKVDHAPMECRWGAHLPFMAVESR